MINKIKKLGWRCSKQVLNPHKSNMKSCLACWKSLLGFYSCQLRTSSSTAQMHVLPWQLSEGKRDSSFSVSKLMAGGGAKFCFFIEYLLGVKIASVFLFLQYPAPLASFLTWAAWLFGCFWKDKERGENIYHLQKCKWTLSQPLKGDSANFHSYPK